MVALNRRHILISPWANKIYSFCIAFAFYLAGLFIFNDLLLFIPAYANIFFTHVNLITASITAAVAFISLYSVIKARSISLTRYKIASGKKVCTSLVLLSDLHIEACSMPPKRLQKIIKAVNRLKPDFIVLAGDIIESDPYYFCAQNFSEILQKLKSAYPPLAVLGNHEYYGGKASAIIKALQDSGIIVLRDKAYYVPEKNIYFIGRDDKINFLRQSLENLLDAMPPEAYSIVIDHDPKSIPETLEHKLDLQLSGHTHNGQIFPFNLLVKRLFMNAYGCRRFQNTDTVVSSGIGTWGPGIRCGTKSEIVYIEISPN